MSYPMRIQPSLLWTWNRTIDRVPYLLTGFLLFLFKFSIDWRIAKQGFNRAWSPSNYLIWPNDRVARVFELNDPERWFSLTMLLVSLPFIWTGVILSLHRLRATGLPLGLILFFFVPIVNLLLFLILVLLPTKKAIPAIDLADDASGLEEPEYPLPAENSKDSRIIASEWLKRHDFSDDTHISKNAPLPWRRRFEPLRDVHRSIVLESYWRSGLVALAITVPLAVLGVVLSAELLQSYGFSLFVGAPFAVGMFSVLLFGFSRPQPLGACLL